MKKKIVYFYFSDQADITFAQFEEYLVTVETDLWSLIKNSEIFQTAEQQRQNSQAEKKTFSNENKMVKAKGDKQFIDENLYAKDAMINTMSTFLKIGARIQHKEVSAQDIINMITGFNFGRNELAENGKMVIQVIHNHYNSFISNTKLNSINLTGNQNIVSQDVSKAG